MERISSSKKPPSEYVRLFVQDVLEFSSQYGKENSNSYTVANIRSQPHYYPKYGDFLESSVLRTYGPWWSSSKDTIPIAAQPFFISADFIEVKFEHKLLIDSVIIYETYNPGAVCVIYAFDYAVYRWVCVWSVFHENVYRSNTQACNRSLPAKASRKFEPNLTRKNVFSDKIRLEFECSNLDYYTELDAVEISGIAYDLPKTSLIASNLKKTAQLFDNIKHSLSNLDINENKDSNTKLLINEPQNKIAFKSSKVAYPFYRSSSILSEKNADMQTCANIVDLPNEILCMILTYLDLKTLSRLRSTCQTFQELCSFEFLYSKLDLQPYWNLIDEEFIEYLTQRTDKIAMLNLSWTKMDRIEPIESLFEISCQNLIVIQLNSCSFMTASLLKTLVKSCTQLTSLSLRSCTNIEGARDNSRDGFMEIKKLRKLKFLDLYRTMCGQAAICEILESCGLIEGLNLGACVRISDFDEVMAVIGDFVRGIKRLDLWRGYSLTSAGINELSRSCFELEELDIGWCRAVVPIDSLQELIKNCKNIKKLFLTSLKITDFELEAISKYLTKLEKLDILGSNLVSYEGVEMVLHKCKCLKFFDISFCNKIDVTTHHFLCEVYTQCSIKKSFQTEI